jgi:hypothetical protein
LRLSSYRIFISLSNLFAILSTLEYFMNLIVFFDDFLQKEFNNCDTQFVKDNIKKERLFSYFYVGVIFIYHHMRTLYLIRINS